MAKPYGYVRADGKGMFIYGEHQFTNNQDHDLVPVYTHPKEWVDLTDEDIWDAFGGRIGTSNSDVNPIRLLADARRIEAKLKEKNSA